MRQHTKYHCISLWPVDEWETRQSLSQNIRCSLGSMAIVWQYGNPPTLPCLAHSPAQHCHGHTSLHFSRVLLDSVHILCIGIDNNLYWGFSFLYCGVSCYVLMCYVMMFCALCLLLLLLLLAELLLFFLCYFVYCVFMLGCVLLYYDVLCCNVLFVSIIGCIVLCSVVLIRTLGS